MVPSCWCCKHCNQVLGTSPGDDEWFPAVGGENVTTKCREPVLGVMNGSQIVY